MGAGGVSPSQRKEVIATIAGGGVSLVPLFLETWKEDDG